jgi:thiamine-phosphate pyrophosphorylase
MPSGLYAIVDLASLERAARRPLEFAEQVLEARPKLLQLRAKAAGARDTLELLRALVPICHAAGAQLFANDRPDLALLAGADGVHVGQGDIPLAEVRRFSPTLKLGTSTHSLAELERALAERPDYVAFGPVFATPSKANHEPVVGLELLEAAHERTRAAGVPLVAIGGISLERAPHVAPHCELAAVIGALIPESGGAETVRERALLVTRALGTSAQP